MINSVPSRTTFSSIFYILGYVALSIVRISLDVLGVVTNTYLPESFTDDLVRSIATTVSVSQVVIAVLFFIQYFKAITYSSRTDIFRDLQRVMTICLGLIVLMVLDFEGVPQSVLGVIVRMVSVSMYTLATLYTGGVVWRTIEFHKSTKTKSYLKVLAFGMASGGVFAFIGSMFEGFDSDIFTIILAIVLTIVLYTSIKRRSWIVSLTYEEKKKLILISLGTSVFSSIQMFNAFFGSSNSLLASYMEGSEIFMGLIFLFMSTMSDRFFWTALFSLPNSSVIERRTFEFSSVAYLNKISSETTDTEKMFVTLVQLAHQATRSTGAWCEIFDTKSATYRRASSIGLNSNNIEALTEGTNLRQLAQELTGVYTIESIQEHQQLSYLYRSVESFAQSIIIAPLRVSGEFVGCLYLVNSQQFVYEQEDTRAVEAFVSSACVALDNARLVHESLEKERYHRELIVGRQIQRKLLPQSLPVLHGFSFAAMSDPALEVGGDYYDFFTLANGTTCIIIADVSGKGISAAFYMAKLKGVCLAVAQSALTPSDMVKQINATLYGSMERQMYITLIALSVQNDGTVSYVRAGHPPLLVYKNNSLQTLQPNGLGIGLAGALLFNKCLQEITFTLLPGDAILLFTDGCNEARSPDGAEIGIEGVQDNFLTAVRNTSLTTREKLSYLHNALNSYSLHGKQHDDITMIIVECASSSEVSIDCDDELENITIGTS